jgi:hypothetical protein
MAFSEANLKRNGEMRSPVFKKFLYKHVTQVFAYPHSAIFFSHTLFIGLPRFMGTPNPVRILYNTSFPTELQAILKSRY